MWAAKFYTSTAAQSADLGGTGRDGIWLPGGARSEGGLPGTAGDRHRRRRVVPHERRGTGDGARREDRGEGDDPH